MRSSNRPRENSHVSTTPPARPTAITPSASAQRSRAEKLSRSFTDVTLYNHWVSRLSNTAPFTTYNEFSAIAPNYPSIQNENGNRNTPSSRHDGLKGPGPSHRLYPRASSPTLSSRGPGPRPLTPTVRAVPISPDSETSFANTRQSNFNPQDSLHTQSLAVDLSYTRFSLNPTRPQPTNSLSSLSQHQPIRSQGPSSAVQMAESQGRQTGDVSDPASSTEKHTGVRQEAFSEKRNRSSSRNGNDRVEKRIEATMANAEPASTARSRKSSHILGLFKENTASQEPKRSLDRARTSSGMVKQDILAENQSEDKHTMRAGRRPLHATSTIGSSADDEAITDSEESPASRHESRKQPPPSMEGTSKRLSDQKLSKQPGASPPLADVSNTLLDRDRLLEPDVVDKSKGLSRRFDDRSEGGLPIRLLEEIRNYHNLTAPFKDKFKSNTPAFNLNPGDLGAIRKSKGASPDKFQNTVVDTEEEEDESDKEQISSALYYPHQAPSPDALQNISIESLKELEGSQQGLESLQSGATSVAPYDDDAPSEDVDIALQSPNESRYLHGDLQRARKPSEYINATESSTSSALEPEYDSPDETARSINGEDSSATDDTETTPIATPKVRSPFLHSRSRRDYRIPAAPLGAVELKPYNHQVGGHTTVFRFSKRAVCKQLSNRENEFYEVVERQHRELLRFLPRYDALFLLSFPSRPRS